MKIACQGIKTKHPHSGFAKGLNPLSKYIYKNHIKEITWDNNLLLPCHAQPEFHPALLSSPGFQTTFTEFHYGVGAFTWLARASWPFINPCFLLQLNPKITNSNNFRVSTREGYSVSFFVLCRLLLIRQIYNLIDHYIPSYQGLPGWQIYLHHQMHNITIVSS